MEVSPLEEVDLREVTGPLNRAVSNLRPLLRTATQLRERATAGVLDVRLSRVCTLGGKLVGVALLERVTRGAGLPPLAHLDALVVDPLAQQRGGQRILVEAVCAAAAAADITRLTAIESESDAATLDTLQRAGFARVRPVLRLHLPGAPAPIPTPTELEDGKIPEGLPAGQLLARVAGLDDALAVFARYSVPSDVPFGQHPIVLKRLASRLAAWVAFERGKPPVAAAIIDAERKLIVAAAGEQAALAGLTALLAARPGVTLLDGLPEGHPAEAALLQAGFQRAAMRIELVREF